MEICLELEEIQMTPYFLARIIRSASRNVTLGALKSRTGIKIDPDNKASRIR